MKSRNSNLDFVRGLAVIFVVFIHIRFPNVLGEIGSDLGCLCNALFFLLSGYFAFNNSKYKIKEKAIRCLLITIGAYLLYAIIYQADIKVIIGGIPKIFLADVKWCGNLWFAMGLMYCYIIYYFIGNTKYQFVVIAVLAFYIIINSYPKQFNNIIVTLIYGVPVFFIGNYIAWKKENEGVALKPKILVIGVLVGLLLNFANIIDGGFAALIHRIGCVVYATCAFLWAIFSLQKKFISKNWLHKKVELIGSKYYLYFFIFQYITINCVWAFSSHIDFAYIEYFTPIIVVILLFFEALVFELVKKYVLMAFRHLRQDWQNSRF